MKPPLLTAIQKRDVLIKSYMDSYRHAKIAMTRDEVERQVIADCELVDAAARAGELSNGAPVKPATKPAKAKRPDVFEQAQHESGVRLLGQSDKPPEIWKPSFMFRNPQQVSERWGYAVARIARICEGGTKDGALAVLAREYKTLYACFLLRNVPPIARGFRTNQFDGLSDRDAARAFMRAVEDVCDRSTGVLRSWITK